MNGATATARGKPSVDGVWRRLGRGVLFTATTLLAMSSVLALIGTGLYVAAHPVIIRQLVVHLVVWWRWLG